MLALPISPTKVAARDGRPNGLTRKARNKYAAPPKGSPPMNRIIASIDMIADAIAKITVESASTKVRNAVKNIRSSTNGAAIIFKISLIKPPTLCGYYVSGQPLYFHVNLD